MSKTFPQKYSEVFLNFKSLHYAEQKNIHQRVLTEYFEKRFEKKHMSLFGFSKKKLFGSLHLFWISLWVS